MKRLLSILFVFGTLTNSFSQTKEIRMCFFTTDSIPIEDVNISIEYSFGDSVEFLKCDTSNCITLVFNCSKAYLLHFYHEDYYTIIERIKSPCSFSEDINYYFEIMKISRTLVFSKYLMQILSKYVPYIQ